MSSSFETVVGDRALSLAVLGGSVTSLAGVVGYVLPALRTTHYRDGMGVTGDVLGYFAGRSLPAHAVLLVFVPFATTVLAMSVARRWGLTETDADLKIALGVVCGPLVTVVAAAIVAVAVTGATNGAGVMAFAFLFGIPITMIILSFVAATESAGTLCGYVLVRALASFRRTRT